MTTPVFYVKTDINKRFYLGGMKNEKTSKYTENMENRTYRRS